jgi:hypothetical protein
MLLDYKMNVQFMRAKWVSCNNIFVCIQTIQLIVCNVEEHRFPKQNLNTTHQEDNHLYSLLNDHVNTKTETAN